MLVTYPRWQSIVCMWLDLQVKIVIVEHMTWRQHKVHKVFQLCRLKLCKLSDCIPNFDDVVVNLSQYRDVASKLTWEHNICNDCMTNAVLPLSHKTTNEHLWIRSWDYRSDLTHFLSEDSMVVGWSNSACLTWKKVIGNGRTEILFMSSVTSLKVITP